MPADAPTRPDWLERLIPGHASAGDAASDEVAAIDLEEAARRLTAHPAVQRWLRETGFEAARGLSQGDAAARACAHGRMMRDLEEQFPALVEAVREATGGCGEVALQWRPLQPNYSKLHLTFFGGAFEADVFCALSSPALSRAEQALRRVAAALPKGEPFPGRPNEATGVLARGERCLGVRYRERAAGDEGPRRSVALLPAPDDETDEHSATEAARGVVAYFAPEERERWYER